MSRIRADALLLLTALIWGSAFIAQKTVHGAMGPLAFVGGRFLIAAVVIAPLAWGEARSRPAALDRSSWGLAALCGACLLTGSYLQQAGMSTASATHAGFLTALYVVLVPFIVWALTRRAPRAAIFLASAVSVLGAWLLTGAGGLGELSFGDVEVAVADFAWALGIALTPTFLRRAPRPFLLCFTQNLATGVIALGASALWETSSWAGLNAALPSLLYAGLLSSGVGFTLQVVAQEHAPPAEAALILSLEAVFAAIAGACLLGERLTLVAASGCVLILLGVVLVEIGPALSRRVRA